ncbi:hypothetical protein EVAR_27262_1 [Eumeta japonica]|uniref:Peptidase A2 domain-containing protein n=1 Tax=Eumeta variegata TaxID=151549 RepID=A0A4C1W2L4_EUMVA|nr:hypothetical protein EVAR_27262_1 [Eumeta japonica]
MQFLVDTGSELCVFPRLAVQQRRTRTTYQLSAANGTTINTYGYVNLELNLSLRRAYPWRFVVADVTKPIIGADFLQFYNLMVDIRNRRLIDNTTTHVFLREDTIRSCFQPAYTGPHEVLKRGDKIFTILVNGKRTTVSIERIKPAYTVDDELLNTVHTATREPKSVPELNPEHRNIKRTRSGRTVRFPDYYRP